MKLKHEFKTNKCEVNISKSALVTKEKKLLSLGRPLSIEVQPHENQSALIVNIDPSTFVGTPLEAELEDPARNMLKVTQEKLLDVFSKYCDERGVGFFLYDLISLIRHAWTLRRQEIISQRDFESLFHIGTWTDLCHNRYEAELMVHYHRDGKRVHLKKPSKAYKKNDFDADKIPIEVKVVQSIGRLDISSGAGVKLHNDTVESLISFLQHRGIQEGFTQAPQGMVFVAISHLITNVLLYYYIEPPMQTIPPKLETNTFVLILYGLCGQNKFCDWFVKFQLSDLEERLAYYQNKLLTTYLRIYPELPLPLVPEGFKVFTNSTKWLSMGKFRT